MGHETFVVYIASFKSPSNNQESDFYPSCRGEIAALIANKAPTLIPTKWSDFANVFSLELVSELFKQIGINNHAIELVDDWQPTYRPI